MPRFFSLELAQSLLPEVEDRLRQAMQAREGLEQAETEIRRQAGKAQVMGGVLLDPVRMAEVGRQRSGAALALRESMEGITDLGVQVKDLDTGLVDFPTLYRGAEVLLCWRLGEKGISHWHGLEEGFRGRKRIDRDFLDHHAGDAAH
jgi:hypothetical protein